MSQLFHAPPQSAETDERYTPRWVFDGMGLHFDIDVAAPPDGPLHTPCDRWFSINDDGLAQPWGGLVFCNPPYSQSTAWADRFVAHANGVFLGPLANSRWFRSLLAASELVWFCDDFAFIHPEHSGRRAGMALIFAAIGTDACWGVRRLAEVGPIGGQLMAPIDSSTYR